MGRRALPKIDSAIDLSRHLRELEQLSAPLSFREIFGRDAPLEIEIGSGKGLFLLTAAKSCRDRHFVGVELARKYARFAAGRLASAQLSNAVMIQGDGLRLLRDFIATESVSAVHVYFPDPWWKKRHKKRRVMNEACLRDIERVLLPGAPFHFWTDVQEYFESTLQLISQVTQFGDPLPVPERPAVHELDYRTHFERRMRLHNLPVYRSEFRKSGTAYEGLDRAVVGRKTVAGREIVSRTRLVDRFESEE